MGAVRRISLATTATIAALFVASIVHAQDPHPAATKAAAAPPNESLGTVAGTGGANKATAFQAQFDASADEKVATAVIGWKDGVSQYALTFKGPLNAKTREATPISLEGLSNGGSVQFAANRLFWRAPDEDEQQEIADLCAQTFPTGPCDYEKMSPGKNQKRMEHLLHLDDIPWYLGISGGASVTTYNFLQGTDLTKSSDTKTDYTFMVRAGVFTPQLGFLVGSAGFQRTSSPGGDSVSLCRPLPGTSATTCSDAILKPPTETTGGLVTFQARRFLKGDVAIAPTIQRDVKKQITSVIIPVYFLKDSKGSPIGGLRGGWRSDTHAVVVSLFIGAAFQLTSS